MTDNTNTTPASSLSDKERELIAQMPYEEARDKLIQARSVAGNRRTESRSIHAPVGNR